MIFFEPHQRDRSLFPWDPFKAMIAPRPVGWISTRNRDGLVNLAPYSFFNAFSGAPPIVGFCSEGAKDSQTFAIDSGEFVWNMATYDLRDQMNMTSAPLTRGESEFVHAGLETAPCMLVKPPRVAASPCALECKVTQAITLLDKDGGATDRTLVLGQVIGLHVDERYLKDGMIDIVAMKPIARCGYQDYTAIDRVFPLKRPEGAGNAAGGG
ncbi:MAG TPA: flavin reductase family protein [Beijerinckiaceae bacterium]|jgi:flavin reductase (DIM6/NTAB) family NADH-FMN oxidoreductase RutF